MAYHRGSRNRAIRNTASTPRPLIIYLVVSGTDWNQVTTLASSIDKYTSLIELNARV